MRFVAPVLCVLLGIAELRAHPEIADALERLNAQIRAAPADADLHLERGDLYARHEEWVPAEANYLTAAELAPTHPGVARSRGALALATGRPLEAKSLLDAAVAGRPEDPAARLLRARALAALGDRQAAAIDLDAVLSRVAFPAPDLFLQKADLLEPSAALRAVEEGITRLGPLVVLQLRAIALEESLGRIDDAARRIDQIAAGSERPELWLRRKGDLLARASRPKEAATAYAAALTAVAALPAWLRESPEIVTFARELSSLTPATH